MTNLENMMKSENRSVGIFSSTINNLANSQGYYSRLKEAINDKTTEELAEVLEWVEKKNFKEPVDVVLALEGGEE